MGVCDQPKDLCSTQLIITAEGRLHDASQQLARLLAAGQQGLTSACMCMGCDTCAPPCQARRPALCSATSLGDEPRTALPWLRLPLGTRNRFKVLARSQACACSAAPAARPTLPSTLPSALWVHAFRARRLLLAPHRMLAAAPLPAPPPLPAGYAHVFMLAADQALCSRLAHYFGAQLGCGWLVHALHPTRAAKQLLLRRARTARQRPSSSSPQKSANASHPAGRITSAGAIGGAAGNGISNPTSAVAWDAEQLVYVPTVLPKGDKEGILYGKFLLALLALRLGRYNVMVLDSDT